MAYFGVVLAARGGLWLYIGRSEGQRAANLRFCGNSSGGFQIALYIAAHALWCMTVTLYTLTARARAYNRETAARGRGNAPQGAKVNPSGAAWGRGSLYLSTHQGQGQAATPPAYRYQSITTTIKKTINQNSPPPLIENRQQKTAHELNTQPPS